MHSSSLLIVGILAASLAGCAPEVTDLSEGPEEAPTPTPPETQNPAIGLATSDTFEVGLNGVSTMSFNVTGFNGFTGTVNVTASNLPAGVIAAPAMVTIAAPDTAVPATIEFTSSTAQAVPDDYSGVVLTAEAASVATVTDDFALTIKSEFHADTRNDVDNLDVDDLWGINGASGQEGWVIHMGGSSSVFVSFTNRSSATHLIHGDGTANGGINDSEDFIGMDHGNASSEGALNATQTRELRPTTLPQTVVFWCHTHGSPTFQEGRITLKP